MYESFYPNYGNWKVTGDADDLIMHHLDTLDHRIQPECQHGCTVYAQLNLTGKTHRVRVAIRCKHKEHGAKEIVDSELGVLVTGDQVVICHAIDVNHLLP